MQKKLTFLIIIILLVMAASIFIYNKKMQRTNGGVQDGNMTQTYENDNIGFCFEYPDAISFTDVSDATREVYALNLLLQSPRVKNDPDPQSPYDQMHIVANPLQAGNLEGYVARQPSADTTKTEVIIINGLQGIKILGRDAFAGSPIESVYILLPSSASSSSTVVSATYYADTPYSTGFAEIVGSIKTKKASAGCE